MKISILIVNYKTEACIGRCLESIFKQNIKDFEVIIIDNENNPNFKKFIGIYFDRLTLVQNTENIGFGRANNQAASIATGDYLFLVNPDVYLNDTNCLMNLLNFAERNRDAGIISLKILDEDGKESTPPRLHYPGLKYHKKPLFESLPGKIAWVLGAAMLIPSKIFRSVNGFDTDFFLYGEEADLCLRVRKQGLPIYYCQSASLIHIGGVSEKLISEYEYWTKKQNGLHLFYLKNYPEYLWRSILKKDLFKSSLRIFLNYIGMKLISKKKYKIKYDRYCAIKDTSSKALDRISIVDT